MNFDDSVKYLLSLGHETLTIKLGLANISTLLTALGNPQNSYLKIQIAGTNGKGSTAAMLDSISRKANIKTGLYTSPHLINITERIEINGEEVSKDDFARITIVVKETCEQLVSEKKLETLPTFFEQVTAIALLAFKESRVDVAILETGLGGRLDATTAAQSEIVGITPIAFDHQEYLGNILSEIAAEKAATIRPNTNAIIAPQEPEAMNVILARCNKVGVEPIINGCTFDVEGISDDGKIIATFKIQNSKFKIGNKGQKTQGKGQKINPNSKIQNPKPIRLNLRGRHQLINACTAICLALSLNDFGFYVSDAAMIEGLETTTHKGRLERWDNVEPPILFDGAHNVAGAKALRDYLIEFVKEPAMLIFGAMREKEIDEIAAILFPLAKAVILTKPDSPRSASLESFAKKFDSIEIEITENVEEALRLAKKLTPREGLICVTGSLYLVGEAQKILMDTQS